MLRYYSKTFYSIKIFHFYKISQKAFYKNEQILSLILLPLLQLKLSVMIPYKQWDWIVTLIEFLKYYDDSEKYRQCEIGSSFHIKRYFKYEKSICSCKALFLDIICPFNRASFPPTPWVTMASCLCLLLLMFLSPLMFNCKIFLTSRLGSHG